MILHSYRVAVQLLNWLKWITLATVLMFGKLSVVVGSGSPGLIMCDRHGGEQGLLSWSVIPLE